MAPSPELHVLVLARYYVPAFKAGGPPRTLANLVDRLGQDVHFSILASDRDLGDDRPYAGVAVNTWCQVGRARVYYLTTTHLAAFELVRLIRQTPHDILYLNSMFDPLFSQWPLMARRIGLIPRVPTLLAPRGEFAPAALALKRRRKQACRGLSRVAGLHRDVAWQATSLHEAEDIQRETGASDGAVMIAPDMPPLAADAAADWAGEARASGAPLRVCFLSRISRIKNLDFALRVLKAVKTPVQFNVFGPVEDRAYWRECEGLIGQIEPPTSVRYMGIVEHARVYEVLRSHDLLFLPSRGENFGHVILESLTAGTPVLIADTTPWRNLRAAGVGFDLPLDRPDTFVRALSEVAAMDPGDYARWREATRRYARTFCDDSEVTAANLRVFTQLNARGR